MPFYARVNQSLYSVNNALQQLSRYNDHQPPRSEPNKSIRDYARQTVTNSIYEIRQGVHEGRYERVSSWRANDALQAADLITRATYGLSDRLAQGQPANVPAARHDLYRAADLLSRASSNW